jgi:hypothetical protein
MKTDTIDPDLLGLLACPACDNRPPLTAQGAALVCAQCHRSYPIQEGIPILLVEEATLPPDTNPSKE